MRPVNVNMAFPAKDADCIFNEKAIEFDELVFY